MHGYHWDLDVLIELVKKFAQGQCQYHSPFGETFRGPFKSFTVSMDKTVTIDFGWLCRRMEIIDVKENKILNYRWVMPRYASGPHTISFASSWYYYQEDEDRLKIVGPTDMCRLYLPDDCTNIIETEARPVANPTKPYKRHVPFFRTPQAHFFRVAFYHFLFQKR